MPWETLAAIAVVATAVCGGAVWVIRGELVKFENKLLEKLDTKYAGSTHVSDLERRIELLEEGGRRR